MSKRADQLSRLEQAAARLEEAQAAQNVLLSQHAAATRAKLDALDAVVSGLAAAVSDVLAARALRGTPPGGTVTTAGPPPQAPASPAAAGGTTGEAPAGRRAPRKPAIKASQEKP